MANIVLKDKNGANIVYKNVDYVSFQTPEGRTVRFNERAADIISVTELPTEDINDNAIYRLTTQDADGKTIVEFYAHENSGEWIEVAEGAKLSDLEITENGEYVPVEAEDGFAKVKVSIDTFTDVAELPLENIDDEAIYRVITKDADTGSVVIVNAELVSTEAGEALGRVFNYFVVDELPASDALEAPTTDDAGVVTANAYILRSTGVPYYTAADENDILFLNEMALLTDYEFKGALPAEVTEAGVYSTITIGTTYTTYGLLDADNTKTVLEFTADEGWVECGAGGANAVPIEITANGIYDETTLHDYIGDLVPDNVNGRYVYKNKIAKEVLAELMTYANEDGDLYSFLAEQVEVITRIIKVNGEYILCNNIIDAGTDTLPIGQYYCTRDLYFMGADFKFGWNVVGAKFNDSMDASKPLAVGDTMRVFMLLPETTTIMGKDGLLDFYRDNLLWKKVDMENPHLCQAVVGGEQVGTYKEESAAYTLSQLDLTIDQIKEIPAIVAHPEIASTAAAYQAEALYQFILSTEEGAKIFLSVNGAPVEMIDQYEMFVETDSYFLYNMGGLVKLIYVKDLTANGAEDLVGAFEEGNWYVNGNLVRMYLQPYIKTTNEAYNPVIVNIPNAGTIVEVESLPTSDVDNSKIYKITESVPPTYDVLLRSGDGTILVSTFVKVMGATVEYHVVDSLPTEFVSSSGSDWHLYIIRETGEVYESTDGITSKPVFGSSEKCGGIIYDPEDMPTDAIYCTIVIANDPVITYGLANIGLDKTLYEYNSETSGWQKCGSGDRLMDSVDSLPIENIDNTKVYCIKNEIEEKKDIYAVSSDGRVMGLNDMLPIYEQGGIKTTGVYYYMVDTLPETPEISVIKLNSEDDSAYLLHCYILNSLDEEPFISKDGTTYIHLSEETTESFGEYAGIIKHPEDAVATGNNCYYLLLQDYSLNYTYGIPNSTGNKTIYEYDTEWALVTSTVKQVESLPTENVVDDTIYTVPATAEVGTTIGIVDTADAKTIMVYKNGAWVRFVEETTTIDPESGDSTDPEATDPESEATDPEVTT